MNQRPKYLSDDELARLLRSVRDRRHANAERDRVLLTTLATLGLRPSEVLSLRVEHLHLSENPAWIRVRRLKRRKTSGVDDVPVPQALTRLLKSYLRHRARRSSLWLFPSWSRRRDRPISVRSAERLFKLYATRAGIAGGPKLYSLRHTAGRRAYAVSKDLRLVQSFLGHSTSRTTEIYAHLDPDARRALVEKLEI